MSVQLIVGSYNNQDNPNWLQTPVGSPSTLFIMFANNGAIAITCAGPATITGTNAADWTIPVGVFPFTIPPGQTALIPVVFTPSGGGARSANVGIPSTGPTLSVPVTGTGGANASAQPDPSVLFPSTIVGNTNEFDFFTIVNTSGTPVTISQIRLTTGVDYTLVFLPSLPFVIPAGGASPTFGVQFTPTLAGVRTDKLNVGWYTNTASGTNFVDLQGTATVLVSAFTMIGATQGLLMAFPNAGAPLVKVANPNSLNSEEAGAFVRLHEFMQSNTEKHLLRVRGHYEDLGVASFIITAKTVQFVNGVRKITTYASQPVNIGTIAADAWPHEFIGEVEITGEMIQLTFSRGANSGPVSIIDYVPEFETKGEVIGGT